MCLMFAPTALSYAVEKGYTDCAELLMNYRGWSLCRWQNTGETLLHLAVRFRHEQIAKRLVAVAVAGAGASQWQEGDTHNLTPKDYQKLFDVHRLPLASRLPPEQNKPQKTEKKTPPDWQCQTIENNRGKLETVRLRTPTKEDRDEWSRQDRSAREAGKWACATDDAVDVIQQAEQTVSQSKTQILHTVFNVVALANTQ